MFLHLCGLPRYRPDRPRRIKDGFINFKWLCERIGINTKKLGSTAASNCLEKALEQANHYVTTPHEIRPCKNGAIQFIPARPAQPQTDDTDPDDEWEEFCRANKARKMSIVPRGVNLAPSYRTSRGGKPMSIVLRGTEPGTSPTTATATSKGNQKYG
jgi:hypothetical protein